MPHELRDLTVILAVAVVAPLVTSQLARWVVVGSAVLELALGFVVGPSLLGWAGVTPIVTFLYQVGLTMVLFVAGYEMDVRHIEGKPLQSAAAAWAASLLLGLLAGAAIAATIFSSSSWFVIGLALTTTAVGVLLPLLRDAGEAGTAFGVRAMAAGVVGEFAPVVAISVVLTTDAPLRTSIWLVVFTGVAAASVAVSMLPVSAPVQRVVRATLGTSSQLIVRFGLLVLIAMVWAAAAFGLDVLLGAFAAGLAFRQFARAAAAEDVELVDAKFTAIAQGIFIPCFFIVSGMRLDLGGLVRTPALLLAVPLVVLLFVFVRGLPTWLLTRAGLGDRAAAALALYAATALPLVVVITGIGTRTGRLEEGAAAALVTAAVLSALVLPVLAGMIRSAVPGSPAGGMNGV